MRGKRSKAYRKLMAVYAHSFGFREPYQVLVDPAIVQDSLKFKMDLVAGLERTLQGKVKPMITQCCIRHLYATDNQPLIALAKTLERRRCNHSISDDALPSHECLLSVVIPSKDAPIPNKHRYVVATDDQKTREQFRAFPGIPGIHIARSVMMLDQVSDATATWRDREEKGKLRSGLKEKPRPAPGKRKRDDDASGSDDDSDVGGEAEKDTNTTDEERGGDAAGGAPAAAIPPKKKKKLYGKKQPNPLSMLKKKKTAATQKSPKVTADKSAQDAGSGMHKAKRKRKRAGAGAGAGASGASADTDAAGHGEEGTSS
ncbi:hypothetical protein DRE_00969 [Drechslerella stenobrocha 248]|uniref:U three protein 23 n=1 Tax=Drechslerella stenobrocha 248 TaxID=1043628 RepID=W7I7F9_9PEZI|nr:hypothetical protein DRE_00969 [Drechslerella stenobrocha 248]